MKKTAQSLLTAAVFASALGTSLASNAAEQPAVQEASLMSLTCDVTLPSPIYGPPIAYTTTATTPYDLNDLSKYPQPEYGPINLYDTPEGTILRDGRWDARDIAVLLDFLKQQTLCIEKEYLIDSRIIELWKQADFNQDGTLTQEDVEELLKFMLAKPNEPAVTTTTFDNMQDVYGPPSWFSDIDPIATETIPTSSTVQLVYGPPPAAW